MKHLIAGRGMEKTLLRGDSLEPISSSPAVGAVKTGATADAEANGLAVGCGWDSRAPGTRSGFAGMLVLLAVLGMLGVSTARAEDAAAAPGARVFLQERVKFDSHCLTIDGKDVFLYSGAFHYFRCPKAMWADRFQKIKDAGFNGVETYVAWNWCERQMPSGLDDFSKADLTDLDDFLTMAESYGLYVLVRPGPYICAEWDTGGYPQWLTTKKPAEPLRQKAWLRTDDPVYLAWCKHWYQAVCPVIARHQVTRKPAGSPGVILVQLENEYDYAGLPAEVMLNQVESLGETARAAGIDVPFFTCWTHPVRGATNGLMRQVFDACNFYPRWGVDSVQKDIDQLRREQPDAPLATTELQGGWFAQVGGKLSEEQDGVTASQINNLTLFAIQNGETILNYYMLYGGTNPDDWGARSLTTTYDYNAPIREWGGTGDRYQRVWALGHMLREHGARLARSEVVATTVTGVPKDVTVVERRAPDGGRYFFVRTSQHKEARTGTAQVREAGAAGALAIDYKLEPFGSTVLYLAPGVKEVAQGQWLPPAAPAVARPTELPGAVPLTDAVARADFGPLRLRWQKLDSLVPLAQLGIYDNHYQFYQGQMECAQATNLLVEFPAGDTVLATVNGKPVASIEGTGGSALFPLPAGPDQFQLLYENCGHPNGGTGMEAPSGILGAQLAGRRAENGGMIANWRMLVVKGTSKRPEVKANFDDSAWPQVKADQVEADQLEQNQSAVFRAAVEVTNAPADGVKMILTLGRVDDQGWVYVNGKSVGKTTDWSHGWSFDVTKELKPGHNVIAVVVKNEEGAGGLGAVTLGVQAVNGAVPLTMLSRPLGEVQEWWQANLQERHWKPVTIGVSTNGVMTAGAGLTWYRMNFSLPATSPNVWVPWHVRLKAAGNGFLYLNGQPLGRYWEAGPQHDFYLPECWLRFGPGQVNSLTVELRPTEGGAYIESAVVEPYAKFAEQR